MNEKLISLAKLLATDDVFSSNFSSKVIDEEKYELAKTKFSDLTREDFSKFLKKLHEKENKLNELSPVELHTVTGGASIGFVTKLAAATLFVAAMGMTGAMPQQTEATLEGFYKLTSTDSSDSKKISISEVISMLENVEKIVHMMITIKLTFGLKYLIVNFVTQKYLR